MRSPWSSTWNVSALARLPATGVATAAAGRVAVGRAFWLGVLAVLICAACRTVPGAASAPVAAIVTAAKATPALRFGPVEEFRGEQLYDFMNGAAVTYLEHRFRILAAADVFRGADQAKIELYEMGSTADAEALYAELTSSPGAPLAAGDAGCFWAGFEPEALFRRGPFLVRLLGYAKDREAAASLLAELAVALDGQLRTR